MNVSSFFRTSLMLTLVLAAAGCSRESPTSPTSPTSPSSGSVNIAGNVDLGGGQIQTVGFNGNVAGRVVTWIFSVLDFGSSTAFFAISGAAETSISATTMSASFTGSYGYVDLNTGREVSCNAANHQLTFVRR